MADDSRATGQSFWGLLGQLRMEGFNWEDGRDLFETIRLFRANNPNVNSASAFMSFARARLLRLERLRVCATLPSQQASARPSLNAASVTALMTLSQRDRRDIKAWLAGMSPLQIDGRAYADSEIEQDHILTVLARLSERLLASGEPECEVGAAVWRCRLRPEEYAIKAAIPIERVTADLSALVASLASVIGSVDRENA
jgi:hypothetical protein